jgi:hypothetical protein
MEHDLEYACLSRHFRAHYQNTGPPLNMGAHGRRNFTITTLGNSVSIGDERKGCDGYELPGVQLGWQVENLGPSSVMNVERGIMSWQYQYMTWFFTGILIPAASLQPQDAERTAEVATAAVRRLVRRSCSSAVQCTSAQ